MCADPALFGSHLNRTMMFCDKEQSANALHDFVTGGEFHLTKKLSKKQMPN